MAVAGGPGDALEAQVEHLSQTYFLNGIIQWQTVNLLPLLPFATGVPPSFNIPISGVPGPRERRYFNGALVEEIYPVSTVYDGMALNVTVCSYADEISVGYVGDRDVIPDIETLIPLTGQALSELESAVGV